MQTQASLLVSSDVCRAFCCAAVCSCLGHPIACMFAVTPFCGSHWHSLFALGEVSSCREQGEGVAARNCCRGCRRQACRAALLRSGQSSPHCLLLERCTGSWLLGRRSVVLPLGGLSVVHCAYLQVCEHFSFWSWGRKGQACWSLGRYGRIIPDIVEL